MIDKTSVPRIILTCFVMTLAACDSSDSKDAPKKAKPLSAKSETQKKEPPKSTTKLAEQIQQIGEVHEKALIEIRQAIPSDFTGKLKERSGGLLELLEEIYTGGAPEMRFIGDGLSSTAAKVMITTAQNIGDHGIKATYFPVEKTQAIVAKIEAVESQLVDRDAVAKPAQLPQLRDVFKKITPESSLEEISVSLKQSQLNDDHLPVAEALRSELSEKRTLFEQRAELLNELELLLMESFLEYATEFRHGKVAHPFRAMKNRRTAFRAFKKRLLEDVATTDFNELELALKEWLPQTPYYAKIQEGLKFYEELAEKGVQTKIGNTVLKPGDKGEAVGPLQDRLREEGFYNGENTLEMDEATVKAVKHYQHTHQLDEDGVVGGGTIRSMNVSFSRRVRQLKLGLTRWRESEARFQKGFFIRVNLPKFEAQFWQDFTLERSHRVVIGSNAYEVDEDRGIHGKLNRTKIFSDEMERMVLNPLWHVPARIKETELDLELIDEPDFYEKNNYTVQVLEDGTEVVYQNAGPGNALGRVKFLFPNDHSIYMHDTAKKSLFKNRIRAYSHGCMRVHNALDLAEYLLERQELMTGKEMRAVLESKEQRGVNLKEHIPVHIDYNTISISDEGNVMFLLDIYEYDKAFFEGEVPLPSEPDRIGD